MFIRQQRPTSNYLGIHCVHIHRSFSVHILVSTRKHSLRIHAKWAIHCAHAFLCAHMQNMPFFVHICKMDNSLSIYTKSAILWAHIQNRPSFVHIYNMGNSLCTYTKWAILCAYKQNALFSVLIYKMDPFLCCGSYDNETGSFKCKLIFSSSSFLMTFCVGSERNRENGQKS